MSQETKFTNYLDPKTFYTDFLDYLVLLDEFNDKRGMKLSITPNEMYWGARIQYGCGLRISEVLNLIKSDFDLNHRILKLYNTKTGKGETQKTSILPYDIPKLEKFLDNYSKSDRIFDTTRSTMWRYYKNTTSVSGIKIFVSKQVEDREGAYTHLLRESCSKMYEIAGARMGIVARKLRHKPGRNMTLRYTMADLNEVLDFDWDHFKNIPA